jgi:hypothetical protein
MSATLKSNAGHYKTNLPALDKALGGGFSDSQLVFIYPELGGQLADVKSLLAYWSSLWPKNKVRFAEVKKMKAYSPRMIYLLDNSESRSSPVYNKPDGPGSLIIVAYSSPRFSLMASYHADTIFSLSKNDKETPILTVKKNRLHEGFPAEDLQDWSQIKEHCWPQSFTLARAVAEAPLVSSLFKARICC